MRQEQTDAPSAKECSPKFLRVAFSFVVEIGSPRSLIEVSRREWTRTTQDMEKLMSECSSEWDYQNDDAWRSYDDGKSSYDAGYDVGTKVAVGAGIGLAGLLLWGLLKKND